jgi:beta-lactam-binding protein with PASTA domain/endonuclease YncB( thermonuclease family)
MFRKLSNLIFVMLILCLVVSCENGDTTQSYVLPDLTGVSSEDAENLLDDTYLTFNILFEENDDIEDGYFVRYQDGYSIGDVISTDVEISVYFSINYPELPDLFGYSKSEIISALDTLGISYVIAYETSSEIAEDDFIRYDGNEIGDTVTSSDEVVVLVATSKLVLPDLSGLNQLEIYQALRALDIEFSIDVITDNTVADQTFSSYGDDLVVGDLVDTDFVVTVYIGLNSAQLPDVSNMVKRQIENLLEDENILFDFEYVVNDDYPEDTFAGYKDHEIGDFYEEGIITVQLYKNTFTDNDTSLIFSKYIDGLDGTSDQAVEIYNPTESTINLSNYYVAIYSNGSFEESSRVVLGNVDLLPGETYVIGNFYANGNLLVKADLSSKELVFDGNDTIQLCYENGTFIDTIYNLGDRDFTLDNAVFIRLADVVKGTREFIFSEWSGFVPDYYDMVGIHPVEIPTEISIEIITRNFSNPLGGMDLVELYSVTDGDTAKFTPGFTDNSVRFLGVDTPETYPYVDEWGLEAKAYTKLVLENALRIYVQSDPDSGFTETFGRYLGLIWCDMGEEGITIDILSSTGEVMRTEHLTGWILLNYHLVLNGYSHNYYGSDSSMVFDNKYLVRWFQEAEKYASEHGLGVHE